MEKTMQEIPPQLRSISKSKQPQKFFERFLDNDLDSLAQELQIRYTLIKAAKIPGVTLLGSGDQAFRDSGSISTMKWRQYNVFQFYIPALYKLYNAIGDMVREACEYYEIDFEEQQFMMQGWFNINHASSGKLDWHEHGGDGAPNFHGYYSIIAEPSETHYIAFGEHKINVNKNNRAILSEMGHPHAMGDWSWDGPRITVAYDIIPLKDLEMRNKATNYQYEQHWIPLS
jgi:hypothetical protein